MAFAWKFAIMPQPMMPKPKGMRSILKVEGNGLVAVRVSCEAAIIGRAAAQGKPPPEGVCLTGGSPFRIPASPLEFRHDVRRGR